MNNYVVYAHVFPDGKKYVGKTSMKLRNRWQGGLGYTSQHYVFMAILRCGWSNVKHYILMDGLSAEEAALYEAAFIYRWGTYKRWRGHNARRPRVCGYDDVDVPSFSRCKKIEVEDVHEEETIDKYNRRMSNAGGSGRCRSVRCIENGKVYESVFAAMKSGDLFVVECPEYMYAAIKNGKPLGQILVFDDEFGLYPRPAHWEWA